MQDRKEAMMLGVIGLAVFGVVTIVAIWWSLLSGHGYLFLPIIGVLALFAVVVGVLGQIAAPRRYR